MNVLIDADGCPVVKLALNICLKYGIPCHLFCDTAHEFSETKAIVHIVDKGADSADFYLTNFTTSEDLVITQDYGVAAMCLAKKAAVIHQDGWQYTSDNIEALLLQRHTSKKLRSSGIRMKNQKRRSADQDNRFQTAMEAIIQNKIHG